MSIFELVNTYQLQIAIWINLTLGLLQCGSSSWILYDVNYEEKLLYSKAGFQLGLKNFEPRQWQWQPTYIDRFIDFRPLKKQLELLQICTSLCLVAGAVQALISGIFLVFKEVKKLWFVTNAVAFLAIISCFSLVIHYGYENGWKEKISMKFFYAVSGMHCFVTLHLLAVMGWDLFSSYNESSNETETTSSSHTASQPPTRAESTILIPENTVNTSPIVTEPQNNTPAINSGPQNNTPVTNPEPQSNTPVTNPGPQNNTPAI